MPYYKPQYSTFQVLQGSLTLQFSANPPVEHLSALNFESKASIWGSSLEYIYHERVKGQGILPPKATTSLKNSFRVYLDFAISMAFLSTFVSVSAIVSIAVAQLQGNTNTKDALSGPQPCAIVSSSSSSFYATIPTRM